MATKQVVVMRKKYLNSKGEYFSLRRGKEIAQASHASMAFLTKRIKNSWINKLFPFYYLIKLNTVQLEWINSSFAKVCLIVETEEELLNIYEKAKQANLEVHLITDSGRTEFDGVPTNTCLAIGPDESTKIDQITGNLKLY